MSTQSTIDDICAAARSLGKNEALFLPGECVIARSNAGTLRFGAGSFAPVWCKGDAETLLREHLVQMLDHRVTGYFAARLRRELPLVKPISVADVGRRSFHVVYEATDAAFFAMMALDGCDWFEYEGRPYGNAECWTSDGRHLWVTAAGRIEERSEVVA